MTKTDLDCALTALRVNKTRRSKRRDSEYDVGPELYRSCLTEVTGRVWIASESEAVCQELVRQGFLSHYQPAMPMYFYRLTGKCSPDSNSSTSSGTGS